MTTAALRQRRRRRDAAASAEETTANEATTNSIRSNGNHSASNDQQQDLIPTLLAPPSSSSATASLEPFLWFALILLLTKAEQVASLENNRRSWSALVTVLHLVVYCWVIPPRFKRQWQQQRSWLLADHQYFKASNTSKTTAASTASQPDGDDATNKDDLVDVHGFAASVVLVPVVLQAMALSHPKHNHGSAAVWEVYAQCVALLLPMVWHFPRPSIGRGIDLAAAVFAPLVLLAGVWLIGSSIRALAFVGCWMMLLASLPVAPSFHGVFTAGEWTIATSFVAMGVTELLLLMLSSTSIETGGSSTLAAASFIDRHDDSDATTTTTTSEPPALHPVVSLSGLLGSGLAFASVDWVVRILVFPITTLLASFKQQTKQLRFLVGLGYVVVLPLAVVEAALWRLLQPAVTNKGKEAFSFPMCLFWLWDFLQQVEEPPASLHSVVDSAWLSVPRWYWLVFWMVALVVGLSGIIAATSFINTSAVISRKWFHFLAVILFAPVTIAAPQFMSLSYAIATAVLVTIESSGVRQAWPALNQFYQQHLDTNKGEQQQQVDKLIVSHLALIVGCAAPLWLSECLPPDNVVMDGTTPNTIMAHIVVCWRLFLSQWGILTLGIGDAMGAIVGQTWARMSRQHGWTCYYWGHNKRTAQGSLAMLLSMGAACIGLAYCCCLCCSSVISDDSTNDPLHQASAADGDGVPFSVLLGQRQQPLTYSWAAALVLVTLLEAFTVQLDNLILPLAGVAVLLLVPPIIEVELTKE